MAYTNDQGTTNLSWEVGKNSTGELELLTDANSANQTIQALRTNNTYGAGHLIMLGQDGSVTVGDDGGHVNVLGGNAISAGAGGSAVVSGGNGGGTSGQGGSAAIRGGDGIGAGTGGDVNVSGGDAGTVGTGGSFVMTAGGGGSVSGNGGSATFTAGAATTSGNGGSFTMRGGNAVGTNKTGGLLQFFAGASTGNVAGPNTLIAGGSNLSGTGNGGDTLIYGGEASVGANFVSSGSIQVGGGLNTDDGGVLVLSAGSGIAGTGNPQNGGNLTIQAGVKQGAGTSGSILLKSNATTRLEIDGTGAWKVGGSAGTSGNVLTSAGTGTPPTWTAPLNASSFPIGTILEAPSAPTGGTWLACDGSAVSQSTYASLYTAIGNKWRQYQPTSRTVASLAAATSVTYRYFVYTGSNWLILSSTAANTTVYYSSNLTAWSTSTIGNRARNSVACDGAGTVVVTTTASGTAYDYSTDHGVTWNNGTFPVSSTTARVYWNGARFIFIQSSTTATYSSTDGINWTLRTARPVSTIANMVYLNSIWYLITSATAYYTNSSTDCSAAWSAVASPGTPIQNVTTFPLRSNWGAPTGASSNINSATNLSSCASSTGTWQSNLLSTRGHLQFLIDTTAPPGFDCFWDGDKITGFNAQNQAAVVFYTGPAAGSPAASGFMYKSKYVAPYGINNLSNANTVVWYYGTAFDTTNHVFVTTVQNTGTDPQSDWLTSWAPDHVTSTHFSLPNLEDSTYYIRAL